MTELLHELILRSADRAADAPALVFSGETRSYARLAAEVEALGRGFVAAGLGRGGGVGLYLE
jgi:hypothetical protein